MYTPDEIRNVEFTKSLGGYKTSEVDEFIDRCADTVEALMKEKAELSKKLEVLADKLVEYRNDEDSIRTALLSTQRLGDTVVREANHKAGLILDDANIKAQKIQETAQREILSEKQELKRIQKEVTNFKNRMMSIYREHLELIKVLPEEEEEKAAEAETVLDAVPAASGDGNMGSTPVKEPAVVVEDVPAPVAAVAVPQPQMTVAEEIKTAPAPIQSPAPVEQTMFQNVPQLDDNGEPVAAGTTNGGETSRFADLKFGDDYRLEDDTEEPRGFFKRKK